MISTDASLVKVVDLDARRKEGEEGGVSQANRLSTRTLQTFTATDIGVVPSRSKVRPAPTFSSEGVE